MYQRILVPIDGSPTAQRGLREAIALARLTGGRLRLMHVIDQLSTARARNAYDGYAPDWLETVRRDGTKLLEDAAAQAQGEGIDTDTLLHDSFSPHLAEVVAEEADRWSADLIVLGTHGRRGVGRFLMGSGAESILRLAKVPVLLVRAVELAKVEAPEAPIKVSLPTGALAYE
ncbi:universal stress protein UspA [Rhodoferax koreense]|uniref:Universal stress protein UspA n=1 Tax=Rhodoferax koreensis TaxID=1842727 RepID=A0A1P8JUA1_9BURK|nr:universal stress protein [Rhodoferax koreense]APW37271.1 universal stress protein UspA [Rhodoferax koreense]